MTKKKDEHIHKFKKVNISTNPNKPYLVFKCIKPTCAYYISVALALNKLCECNRCHETMILSKDALILVLPHCSKCTKRRSGKGDDVEQITEFLRKSGI